MLLGRDCDRSLRLVFLHVVVLEMPGPILHQQDVEDLLPRLLLADERFEDLLLAETVPERAQVGEDVWVDFGHARHGLLDLSRRRRLDVAGQRARRPPSDPRMPLNGLHLRG